MLDRRLMSPRMNPVHEGHDGPITNPLKSTVPMQEIRLRREFSQLPISYYHSSPFPGKVLDHQQKYITPYAIATTHQPEYLSEQLIELESVPSARRNVTYLGEIPVGTSLLGIPLYSPGQKYGDVDQTLLIANADPFSLPPANVSSISVPWPKPEDAGQSSKIHLVDFRSGREQKDPASGLLLLIQSPLDLYHFARILKEQGKTTNGMVLGDVLDAQNGLTDEEVHNYSTEFDLIFKQLGIIRKPIWLDFHFREREVQDTLSQCDALLLNGGQPTKLKTQLDRPALHMKSTLYNFAQTKPFIAASAGFLNMGEQFGEQTETDAQHKGLGLVSANFVVHYGLPKREIIWQANKVRTQGLVSSSASPTYITSDRVSLCFSRTQLSLSA